MTMTISSASRTQALQSETFIKADAEREIVTRLEKLMGEAGWQKNASEIVNLYVALKSKPLVIMIGPAQAGKIALVQGFAQILTGGHPEQCQTMVGHARWAARSDNVALFTEAQTRLNASKIIALIEDAGQPENADKVFIAGMTRISPAELIGFFADLAFQLQHGQIMNIPGFHLAEPLPYPPNLFMIGTMDTARFDWWDADLLPATTIIQWPAIEARSISNYSREAIIAEGEREFLQSRLRDKQAARQKLQHILGRQRQPLEPLHQLRELLEMNAVHLPLSAVDEVVVYLANSWSREGTGLFDRETSRNATIALDFAIAQCLLPRIGASLQFSAVLRLQIEEMLKSRFARSMAFLESLG